jgi:hypothetical protein
MFLYRFEVETEEQTVDVVVAANNQEEAFLTAEKEVEKNFLKLPVITYVTLLEKKPIRKTAAFVVE